MKTVAVIQARMGSTRLPGKVLKMLGTRPVLWHVVHRVKACPEIDDLVVATTTSELDQDIVQFCLHERINVYRGSESDVLSRYYEAARMVGADVVLRFTADCPLLDPGVIGAMIRVFHAARTTAKPFDYFSNIQRRTFPRGLDTEIFTFAALALAHQQATQAYEREHVTPYLYQHPEQFACGDFVGSEDASRYRLTLDTPDDFDLLAAIFAHFAAAGPLFSLAQVLGLLRDRPELEKLNAHVEQKKLTG